MGQETTTAVCSNDTVDIKSLLEQGYTIVCDTNIFLNFYRLSPDYASFALDCMRAVQDYIVIPSTVKLEFKRNFAKEFTQRKNTLDRLTDEPKKLIENQREKLKNNFNTLVKKQFPDVEQMIEEIDEAYDNLSAMITNYFDERSILSLLKDSWESDVVESFVNELVQAQKVMSEFTTEELYNICAEGETRYKKRTPPGFEDAKSKDGIRKYSDLIMWKEVIRYARENQSNIIFVTDDIKPDWWDTTKSPFEFLPALVSEFEKGTKLRATSNDGITGPSMKIKPLTSTVFFEGVSTSLAVTKSDLVEQALLLTDDDYIDNIQQDAMAFIHEELPYSEHEYIEESILTYVGSDGFDVWSVDTCEFDSYIMHEREQNEITYHLLFHVEASASSYDYFGKDYDTKELILSNPYEHEVAGTICVEVKRNVNHLLNFVDNRDYESMIILSADFDEESYSVSYDEYEDEMQVPDAYSQCGSCGKPIGHINDAGNGFCTNCSVD